MPAVASYPLDNLLPTLQFFLLIPGFLCDAASYAAQIEIRWLTNPLSRKSVILLKRDNKFTWHNLSLVNPFFMLSHFPFTSLSSIIFFLKNFL